MFFKVVFDDMKTATELGIIKKTINDTNYAFDVTNEIDLDRLSKFITFDIKMRKTSVDK